MPKKTIFRQHSGSQPELKSCFSGSNVQTNPNASCQSSSVLTPPNDHCPVRSASSFELKQKRQQAKDYKPERTRLFILNPSLVRCLGGQAARKLSDDILYMDRRKVSKASMDCSSSLSAATRSRTQSTKEKSFWTKFFIFGFFFRKK